MIFELRLSHKERWGLTLLVFAQENQHKLVKLTIDTEDENLIYTQSFINAISSFHFGDSSTLKVYPFVAEINTNENCLQVSGDLDLFFRLMKGRLAEGFVDGLRANANVKNFIDSTKDALPIGYERNTESPKMSH